MRFGAGVDRARSLGVGLPVSSVQRRRRNGDAGWSQVQDYPGLETAHL